MKLNGSQIVLEVLKEQEVDTIFGYPGGTILNIFDELYKYGDTFKHILTAHEQAAAHAADGYARATGKVGVCFATSGPGATNLVTGIATAYMDSIPVVAITCNYATSGLGRDSFQEVDICGITMPITKHSFIVKDSYSSPKVRNRVFILRVKLFGMLHISASNILDVRNIVKIQFSQQIIFNHTLDHVVGRAYDIVGNGA